MTKETKKTIQTPPDDGRDAAAALEVGAATAAALLDKVDTMREQGNVTPIIKRLVTRVLQGMELEHNGYELQIPGDGPHGLAEIAAAFVEHKADEVLDAVAREVAFEAELLARTQARAQEKRRIAAKCGVNDRVSKRKEMAR